MAQSAGFSKNPLDISPFWERTSAEPPLEWTKWPAILEMAVFAKDGIEIRNLLPYYEPAEHSLSQLSQYTRLKSLVEQMLKWKTKRCATKKKEWAGRTT